MARPPLLCEEGNIYRISQHCQFIHALIDRRYNCSSFTFEVLCSFMFIKDFMHALEIGNEAFRFPTARLVIGGTQKR